MALIESQNVHFRYGDGPEVLKSVSIKVDDGDFVALLGANGAGKTTFAKLLNGLLRANRGTIHVDGQDVKDLRTAQLASLVGYCYQNPDHQIFADTVSKELAFGPKNLGISQAETEHRVREVLELVRLEEHAEAYPFLLSKGIRQKIAVASILAMRPKVMIIDEPTTGMDFRGSKSIMGLIQDLNQAGHTLLIITHDLHLVANYARRVVVFSDGSVVFDGPPGELFTKAALLEKVLGTATPVYRLIRELQPMYQIPDLASVDQFVQWTNSLILSSEPH